MEERFLSTNEVGVDFQPPIREEILKSFIKAFNNYIRNYKQKDATSFTMNIYLQGITLLNEYEFGAAKKLASESGWELTRCVPSEWGKATSYTLKIM